MHLDVFVPTSWAGSAPHLLQLPFTCQVFWTKTHNHNIPCGLIQGLRQKARVMHCARAPRTQRLREAAPGIARTWGKENGAFPRAFRALSRRSLSQIDDGASCPPFSAPASPASTNGQHVD